MLTILCALASILEFRVRTRASLELELVAPTTSGDRSAATATRSAAALIPGPVAVGPYCFSFARFLRCCRTDCERRFQRHQRTGQLHAGINVPNDTLTLLETVGPLPLAKHERL
jgi:hypothetical protein